MPRTNIPVGIKNLPDGRVRYIFEYEGVTYEGEADTAEDAAKIVSDKVHGLIMSKPNAPTETDGVEEAAGDVCAAAATITFLLGYLVYLYVPVAALPSVVGIYLMVAATMLEIYRRAEIDEHSPLWEYALAMAVSLSWPGAWVISHALGET